MHVCRSPFKFPPWFQAPLGSTTSEAGNQPLTSIQAGKGGKRRVEAPGLSGKRWEEPLLEVGKADLPHRLGPHPPTSRPPVSRRLCGEFSLRNVTAQKPCV